MGSSFTIDLFKQFTIASTFMILLQFTRWTVKSYLGNEFDKEVKFEDGKSY